MDLLLRLKIVLDNLFDSKQCSGESHALLYAIFIMAVLISAGGVYVWRRFIRTQPV